MTFALITHNTWFRRAAWTVAGLLAACALAWLAVPYLVKSQLEKIGREQLGRAVQVGQVDFQPWRLALTLTDVSVSGPANADAAPQLQVQVQRVLLDVALWQSLRRLAPVVDAIAVDQPVLKITHLGDGTYDFDDILARLNAQPPSPPGPTPAFALHNIRLTGGAVDFVDQPHNRTHTLRDLHLSLPFLSSLDAQREIQSEPHLAFTLNGSSFDSATHTTPFTASRKTDARIQLKNLDLAPYLPYLPASLPVKLQAAVLQADLQLAFVQSPKMSVQLSGTLQADGLRLANPQDNSWLALDSLKVTLDALRPLERSAKIAAIELSAPALDLRRDAAGMLNLLVPPPAAKDAPKNIATTEGAASASGTKDVKTEDATGWHVSVATVALRDGSLRWTDATTQPAAQGTLQQFTLDASAITWPFTQPLQFNGAAQVTGGTAATPADLRFSGSATDTEATVDTQLGSLPLAIAAPYLAAVLKPRLDGQLSADMQVHWTAPEALKITAKQLTLDRLSLGNVNASTNIESTPTASSKKSAPPPGKAALASLRQLQLGQTQLDLAQRRLHIGKLALLEPRAQVARGADQRWMFEDWLKTAPAAANASAPAPSASSKPWAVSVADLQLEGGAVSYFDQAPYAPVAFELTALQIQMKDLAPGSAKASPLSVSARMAAGNTEPGKLSYKGTLALQPLAAQGQLDVVHLPLHALEPYFGESLNIDIVRADTSFKGQLAYSASPAGTVLQVRGDGTLEEFRANRAANSTMVTSAVTTPGDAPTPASAQATGRELLSWKLLNLRGIDVALQPGRAAQVEVKGTALSDFYARIVVDETGRINLQDLVKPSVPAQDATNTVAAPAGAASASGTKDINSQPVIRIGAISLVNGRVLFSDRFVKPNYTANLSALTGKLGAFASVAPQGQVQLADLELRGRAEGTASLEILGKLNPLATPLALDIGAKVKDLELPALSPYSIRYVGHGIERGKLSVDVHYSIQPDGQLTARNSIVLNQLTFGDAVPGAPSSLPVKLAVALLADSNGMIDLDLPLSGSLNDPQFRIGPVIFKILGNLIAKAVTAPFSLLANALGGGGGQELSEVHFDPGSAALTDQARAGLDKVAQALADRPSLKMTVVGSASLAVEREALQRQRLQRRLLAEKRRNTVADTTADADTLDTLVVADSEYPALLKAVYQRASFTKPRNALGLLKDLPPTEMEQLLLANLPVDEDSAQRLAVQRGTVIRDYLAAQKLPLERLFLGAPKTVEDDPKWQPQADLQLALP